MTVNPQDNQAQAQNDAAKPSDKELNFRLQEQKYEKMLAQERAARQEAERVAQERVQSQSRNDDDDDDSEPYIDKRKLEKKLAKFGESNKKQTQLEIQAAVQSALSEERRSNWIKSNPDFYDVLNHAQTFYEKHKELAEDILEMPEGFERQKLVYRNIKALNAHLPAPKQPSIQEKIDSNKRAPYYQPTGQGSSPYASNGDFSPTGQKAAHDKMQELKSRLRLG